MKPIRDHLADNHVAIHAPEDDTLSGGERAQATIASALLGSWDHLDGHQQRAIVEALEQSTAATEEAEAWAREHLKSVPGQD